MTPTPTQPDRALSLAEAPTLTAALDAAARNETGINLYDLRGRLAEVLPWATLRLQARALATRLLAAGLTRGARVGLVAETDGDFIRSFFACLYAGLAPAPLPLPAPFGGRKAYVAHIRRMLIEADASAAFAPAPLRDWLLPAAEGLGLTLAGDLSDLPPLPDGWTDGDAVLPVTDPDDLAYLQFSSGSTRFPLGVAVTQRAAMANAAAIAQDGLHVNASDRVVSWLPLYHDMGLVGFMIVPMACGMSLDLLPTGAFVRRPLLWLGLMSEHRATISYSPTFGYELCARRAETAPLAGLDLSTWRVAGIGGDMIRPSALEAFTTRFADSGFSAGAFNPSYGMAEATLALTFSEVGQGVLVDDLDVDVLERDHLVRPARPGARNRAFARCGHVLVGHQIEVRDAHGHPVGPDREGRLFARGPSLMQAYYNRPAETAEVLTADGWLDTGDLGYFRDEQVVITGRAKDLIIVNGRNIWPQDLEWTAEQTLPTLRPGDVAVFSVPADGEETVVALVQARSGDKAALAREVADLLRARHGVEVAVTPVGAHALPQTSSGKLSRTRAKALYLSGAFEPKAHVQPLPA